MQVGITKTKIVTGSAIVLPGEVASGKIVPFSSRGTFDKEIIRNSCFENLDPALRNRVAKGDILVTGRRFAKGESSEESVLALMGLGFSAIIAVSVDSIFLRNAINLGFPIVILPISLEMINDGDLIEVDVHEAFVRNLTQGRAARGKLLPSVLRRILEAGGIVNDVLASFEKKK